jgi:putative ABC transport system substrate-binding protein
MVVRILEGANPGDMDVESVDTLNLFVNPAAAERMGITLSDDLISDAKEVVNSDQ